MFNRINENIALAKAILNKKNIIKGSPEYDDYLEIRKLVGNSHGYVGVLTKLRFVEGITDMDELQSIYNVLKNSKLDVNKLHKLSYREILDKFYMDLTDAKNPDFELVHRDDFASFYIVHTHKGILQVGSPAWCIKTKSNWDSYEKTYGTQYVAIANKYLNSIISPNNNYLTNYQSKHAWIRYGVSLGNGKYNMCSDRNTQYVWQNNPTNWTAMGVYKTVQNIHRKVENPSYYMNFSGCELVDEHKNFTYHKVINKELVLKFLTIKESHELYDTMMSDKSTLFLTTAKGYNGPIRIIIMNDFYPQVFCVDNDKDIDYAGMSGKASVKILNRQAAESKDLIWIGLRIKLGLSSLNDVDNSKKLLYRNDKWAVFDTDDFWVVCNLQVDNVQLVQQSFKSMNASLPDPLFFYLKKYRTTRGGEEVRVTVPRSICCDNMEIINPIWNEIRKIKKGKKPPETPKKSMMSKFKDFFSGGGHGH